MSSVFVKVSVKDRLPRGYGWYFTNCGYSQYSSIHGVFYEDVKWWLEEVELPSEEDIQEVAPKTRCVNQFWNGVNYILNKLKGETK